MISYGELFELWKIWKFNLGEQLEFLSYIRVIDFMRETMLKNVLLLINKIKDNRKVKKVMRIQISSKSVRLPHLKNFSKEIRENSRVVIKISSCFRKNRKKSFQDFLFKICSRYSIWGWWDFLEIFLFQEDSFYCYFACQFSENFLNLKIQAD